MKQSPAALSTRMLDAVDRAHARAAAVLHNVRNSLLTALERKIDGAEHLASSAIERARHGVKHADHVSADVVNRAQGVVGQAIEKARLARASKQDHIVS
ncbi:MAG: hypothetical protein JWP01_501 [Myxococcales bacterium]|nr:hypothetical protein [Myxococcales bacterium]